MKCLMNMFVSLLNSFSSRIFLELVLIEQRKKTVETTVQDGTYGTYVLTPTGFLTQAPITKVD